MHFRSLIFLGFAVLLSGCASKDVPEKHTAATKVFTQDMAPYSGQEDGESAPGLEGMPDDGQGIIYF